MPSNDKRDEGPSSTYGSRSNSSDSASGLVATPRTSTDTITNLLTPTRHSRRASEGIIAPLIPKLWNLFTPPRSSAEIMREVHDDGTVSGIMQLPDEILVHILSFLPTHDNLLITSLISRRFHLLSQAPVLWSNLILTSDLKPHIGRQGEAVSHPPCGRWTAGGWDWGGPSSTGIRMPGGWKRLMRSNAASPGPACLEPPLELAIQTMSIHYPTLYRSLRHYQHTMRNMSSAHSPHVQVLSDHTDVVYSAHTVNDWLVTGSRDRTIRIWRLGAIPENVAQSGDIGETVLVKTIHDAHEGSVLSVLLDRQAGSGTGWILSGSSDHSVSVWEIGWDTWTHTGKLEVKRIATLTGHTSGALDVALSKSHIVTCSKDASVRVYSQSDFSLVHVLHPHPTPINAVVVNPDSTVEQVVTASGDGSWLVLDLISGQAILRVSNYAPEDGVRTGRGIACLAWKGIHIVTGANDRMIRLHEVKTGRLLRTFTGHSDTVRSVDLYFPPIISSVGADQQGIVVSGGYDHSLRLWDMNTGDMLRSFRDGEEDASGSGTEAGHTSLVLDVQLSGGKLISASHDQTVRVVTFGVGLPYLGLLNV